MLERYPNDVRLIAKQFPLSSHRFAFNAAMGAMAAHNQGKFWPFHKALLKNHNAIDDEKIQSIAKDLGLDMTRFNGDIKSPENRAQILEDVENGRQIGVRGTPSVFINGKKVKGNQLGNLISLIAEELERKAKPSKK